jgi:hypothetical protein
MRLSPELTMNTKYFGDACATLMNDSMDVELHVHMPSMLRGGGVGNSSMDRV